ncbi:MULTISPECIES: GDSL-type esterase/lipase family protein [Arcicella]|uniref:GDSL-type esterase/lipase family protein n=1 Tax=Arcicella lustrica TaxID=2984196 RepID=A0ABU5SNW9_9BACT|nr:GDSL-type esterase/lipase family protein [Arcicella sp. DC25W]MEA5428991.1 GDSL-type esterase/lipase family protein [Arcicella sp. DC25W]
MFWYEDEVKRLEQERLKLPYQPKTAFYGSSTITLWESLYHDFQEFSPVNLGFGGSTLSACAWYFDRVFAQFEEINSVIIYAGDNDLSNNRHPEEIFLFLFQLFENIQRRFGLIDCTYISIKPSPQRWYLNEQVKYTNKIIEREIKSRGEQLHFVDIYDQYLDDKHRPDSRFYQNDGLHFNKLGHDLLKTKLVEHLSTLVLQ